MSARRMHVTNLYIVSVTRIIRVCTSAATDEMVETATVGLSLQCEERIC